MRDRQDPNWERPNTDVPGYEWRDTGAATSAGRGIAGRWPRSGDGPQRTGYAAAAANQTSEPGPSRGSDRRQAPEETSGLDRPPGYGSTNDDYGPQESAYGPGGARPFGDHRYGRPDEWSSQQRSWPNRPARFEDTTSGRGPAPGAGPDGTGMGAGMYWSGESAREDEQMWRPRHDQPDPQRWHRQGFAGRGPRGYRRSDARIGEDVNDRLTDDDYLDASDIAITVEDAVVVLEGTVDSRDAKRRAEDIAESVSGVRDVMNRLDVRGGSGGSGGMLERIGDALGG